MSVLLVTWWSRMGWEKIETWQHPQTTSSWCRRQLPYFCGHVPNESGTRAGGSLSENWPKRPRHSNKTSHWRQLTLLILDLWTFWVNEVHKKIWLKNEWMLILDLWTFWVIEVHKKIWLRGLDEVCFESKVLKTWTSATILSWVHNVACRTYLLLETQ